jgi:enamine deaminase RidA (YjgF/YER057c/UK114 family)
MPFLEVLWNPDRFGEAEIARIRDALVDAAGPALTEADTEHVVNARMVDARLIPISHLDRVRSDLFITLLARHEPARAAAAAAIVRRLEAVAAAASGLDDPVVELSLTQHTSSVDYASLE